MRNLVFRKLQFSALLFLAAALFSQLSLAQTYTRGQHVEPAFEGWRPNPDGTFNMMFGYMNENWEETPDVPVGDDNYFSPGEADRGQPTHFLPRRNRFTFEVTVPADWGDKELVWTLTVNGVERKAYATLRQDYLVDNMVIASETGSLGAGTSSPESRANVPPVTEVIGDNIQCGYHGLTFDPAGSCVRVPSQKRIPPGARVHSYPTIEKQGFIHLWTGNRQPTAEETPFDFPFATLEGLNARYAALGGKFDYRLLIDNLMDLTHLGFTHKNTIGTGGVAESGKAKTERQGG